MCSDRKNMNKIYRSPLVLVEEFHLTYGQPVRITPHLDAPEREMRVALIAEEVDELAEAVDTDDFIEVVDALADILYVAYGAAITHGINLDHLLEVEDNTSPAPIIQSYLNIKLAHTQKTPYLNKTILKDTVNSLREALETYETAGKNQDLTAFKTALVKIVELCYVGALLCNVDIDAILEEVQRSNLSKLDENGNPIRREDGKILKGANFFPPNIDRELKNQGWVS